MGPLLTDSNPEMRGKGTQILVEVLQKLPEDCLQESELHFMTAFFCDRLKDHNAVIPSVLQGILAIVCTYKFTYLVFVNNHALYGVLLLLDLATTDLTNECLVSSSNMLGLTEEFFATMLYYVMDCTV